MCPPTARPMGRRDTVPRAGKKPTDGLNVTSHLAICVVAPTQPSGRACGLDRSCHLGSNSPNYSCVDQHLNLVECPVLAHLCPLNLSLRRSANGWKAEIGQRSSSRDMPRPRCRAPDVTT